jgi:hypothetical protein
MVREADAGEQPLSPEILTALGEKMLRTLVPSPACTGPGEPAH